MTSAEREENLITPEMKAAIGMETSRRTAIEDVTVTEIRRFAQATMDENPIYYDAKAAALTKFKGLVAPAPFACCFWVGRRPLGVPDRLLGSDPDADVWSPNSGPDEVDNPPRIRWPEGYYGFHGGDELEIYQLPKPGERISQRSRLVDVYERKGRSGPIGVTVSETVYTNEKGEVLCINHGSGVVRKNPSK